ncbi:MAG: tRNA (adenosine(37)-N6)-threonylcarbamoyltransferase complex ATPase subunit type 1 TsaE [Desulfobaccales bacterium]
MRPLEYVTNSPRETRDLAARLAARLAPGDIIALNGELGSGKTEFVHGLARGLGVPASAAVASPSFTLVHEYPGRVLLAHLDLYRLEDLPAELLPDLEEYLSGEQVLAVEWAQRLAGLLPKDYLEVRLAILNESQRQLTFLGHGLRGRELLENLKRKTEGRKRKTAP